MRAQITERIHRSIMESRRYNELRKYYPTLEDMRSYAMRKVTALTLGSDNKTVTAYSDLAKLIRKRHTMMSRLNKSSDSEEIEKINLQIETATEKARKCSVSSWTGTRRGESSTTSSSTIRSRC